MDDISALSEKCWAYDRLQDLWMRAKEVIAKSDGRSRGIEHYSLADAGADESWLGFTLAGAECYVAFTHDFESGRLEYGVLDPLSTPRKRIRVADHSFSQDGKLGEKWEFRDNRSIWYAHFSFVNTHAEALAAAYFAAWRGDVSE